MGTNPGDTLKASLDTVDAIFALMEQELAPDAIHARASRLGLYDGPADADGACWRVYRARYAAVARKLGVYRSEYVNFARRSLAAEEVDEGKQPFSPLPDRGANGGERP